MTIKDHKVFLKVYANTFSGQAAIEWLRGHAARAVFGAEADKDKNQQLAKSVALLLAQKLLAVGVFRQVRPPCSLPSADIDERVFPWLVMLGMPACGSFGCFQPDVFSLLPL